MAVGSGVQDLRAGQTVVVPWSHHPARGLGRRPTAYVARTTKLALRRDPLRDAHVVRSSGSWARRPTRCEAARSPGGAPCRPSPWHPGFAAARLPSASASASASWEAACPCSGRRLKVWPGAGRPSAGPPACRQRCRRWSWR
ncbi:hypothetical protein [Nonomuraea roseoviolacea]|uniref:hypothetical protein n=1 Tax=Nonomuraea roseoviolacea TaxID=103837 RepID=UPI003CD0B9F0